jgi:Txe/YoeB family toxin of Txe-Axe toxin-antitoxin module
MTGCQQSPSERLACSEGLDAFKDISTGRYQSDLLKSVKAAVGFDTAGLAERGKDNVVQCYSSRIGSLERLVVAVEPSNEHALMWAT